MSRPKSRQSESPTIAASRRSGIARWAAAAAARLRAGSGRRSARIVNEETLVVVMLESPRGIENCEAIAAVPGIDALLIGTNDLCFEMGIPGQFNDPRVREAYTKVIAACRKHGKFPGMGGMYTAELLQRHIDMGVQLILSGSDFSLLMQAGKARADLVRGFEKKT
jgi:2-keto-3-deoxy-L-rhamnonate aldolase RhmA